MCLWASVRPRHEHVTLSLDRGAAWWRNNGRRGDQHISCSQLTISSVEDAHIVDDERSWRLAFPNELVSARWSSEIIRSLKPPSPTYESDRGHISHLGASPFSLEHWFALVEATMSYIGQH